MGIITVVVVLACGVAVATASVAAFLLTLRALRRSMAREASLRANLVRLNDALRQAERKSLNKSNAFAGASHDIRSALAAITGLVDVSRAEAQANPQVMHHLEQMDVCTNKLLGILNSILDTSKLESGKMQLDEAEFNVADVLEESMDMINIVGLGKGLEVVWDPCDLSILKCGTVVGDCRRLKQILDNLLGNSVKFTQQGHFVLRAWANIPIVRSSAGVVPSKFGYSCFLCLFRGRGHRHSGCCSFSSIQNDPDSVELYFEVDDTGVGIPKEKRELVFEDYVQVKEGQGGTGLGLGIVQSFVRLMGGEISIKDKGPGNTGTCIGFNVFTKMGGNHEQRDIEEGISDSSVESSHQRWIRDCALLEANNSFEGGHCMLLVHGDETRRVLQAWFENLGMTVWPVPQLESLASALENMCHRRTVSAAAA